MTSELKVSVSGKYAVCQVADIMGVDRSTVRRWIETKKLRCGYHRHNKRRFVTGAELTRFFNDSII